MSEWIEWHGGECPVPAGTRIETRYHDGSGDIGYSAANFRWTHQDLPSDIVAYRVIDPAQPETTQRAPSAWQPIESAPEEEEILVWGRHLGQRITWRSEDNERRSHPWCGPEAERYRRDAFTHWRRLPEPPSLSPPAFDPAGLPTERLERIAFALGMTVETARPLLHRLHDAGFRITESNMRDETAQVEHHRKAMEERFDEGVKRASEDRKMRETGIYTLLGRLQELAAEGKGMHADEVRFMAKTLPVEKLV